MLKLLGNLLVLLFILLMIGILWRLWPHPSLQSHFSPEQYSQIFVDKNDKLLRLTTGSDQKYRIWTELESIPKTFQDAVLLHEDRYFYRHFGVNPISLTRGIGRSFILKQRLQGGSTITMQLARMRWQLNTRTFSGKAEQIFRAIQLELSYSKKEILEAYLNYAPYGRNIESIGAASLIYFDKSPEFLTLPESMALAVLPQSPSLRLKDKSGLVGPSLFNARNRLFNRWLLIHPEDSQFKEVFSLPLRLRQPESLPFIAPHFIEQWIKDNNNRQLSTQKNDSSIQKVSKVKTSIDKDLQTSVERQLHAFIRRYASQGIKNASALLVDTRDMGIRALVGSADYFDPTIHGQVNGTRAKRSPGSTLKPFIYALAIEQGILHPATILKDVPTQFGAYSPENFDRRFLGPITATQALNFSRNIPAVNISAQLKKPSLYEFLKNNGVRNLANEKHYGLSLVLGGGEITMQELAALYALLANKGIYQPLNFTSTSVKPDLQNHVQSISEGASFIALQMLAQHPRPTDTLAQVPKSLPIYWKTGTSWAFRDAWTAGIFGPYVLVVWEGNFTGEGNNAFIGIDAAAPLFFNIVDAILAEQPNLPKTINTVPKSVKQIDICLTSGQLPTKWCQHIGKTWFIPGVSPIKADTVFRPIAIDRRTGKVACQPIDRENVEIQVFEFWSSDLMHAFNQAGVAKKAPPKSEYCDISSSIIFDNSPPQITSPQQNITYTLRINSPKKLVDIEANNMGNKPEVGPTNSQQILLSASTDRSQNVYWFIDDSYLGKATGNHSIGWLPEKSGVYRVRVVDENGLADTRQVRVRIISSEN